MYMMFRNPKPWQLLVQKRWSPKVTFFFIALIALLTFGLWFVADGTRTTLFIVFLIFIMVCGLFWYIEQLQRGPLLLFDTHAGSLTIYTGLFITEANAVKVALHDITAFIHDEAHQTVYAQSSTHKHSLWSFESAYKHSPKLQQHMAIINTFSSYQLELIQAWLHDKGIEIPINDQAPKSASQQQPQPIGHQPRLYKHTSPARQPDVLFTEEPQRFMISTSVSMTYRIFLVLPALVPLVILLNIDYANSSNFVCTVPGLLVFMGLWLASAFQVPKSIIFDAQQHSLIVNSGVLRLSRPKHYSLRQPLTLILQPRITRVVLSLAQGQEIELYIFLPEDVRTRIERVPYESDPQRTRRKKMYEHFTLSQAVFDDINYLLSWLRNHGYTVTFVQQDADITTVKPYKDHRT